MDFLSKYPTPIFFKPIPFVILDADFKKKDRKNTGRFFVEDGPESGAKILRLSKRGNQGERGKMSYQCKLCNELFYSISGLCQHECKMGDLLE